MPFSCSSVSPCKSEDFIQRNFSFFFLLLSEIFEHSPHNFFVLSSIHSFLLKVLIPVLCIYLYSIYCTIKKNKAFTHKITYVYIYFINENKSIYSMYNLISLTSYIGQHGHIEVFAIYIFTYTAVYLSYEYAGVDTFLGLLWFHASAVLLFKNCPCQSLSWGRSHWPPGV